MIALENAEFKKSVYFVNDLSEFGGEIFIVKMQIQNVDFKMNRIRLSNGHYYKPNELYFEIASIPGYKNLELKDYIMDKFSIASSKDIKERRVRQYDKIFSILIFLVGGLGLLMVVSGFVAPELTEILLAASILVVLCCFAGVYVWISKNKYTNGK